MSEINFSPDDIIHAPVSSKAARVDIDEAVSAMMRGDSVEQQVANEIGNAQGYIQAVSLNTLRRLEATGIEEASVVARRFAEALEEEPERLTVDLFKVAQLYESERAATPNPTANRRLEKLSSLSRATGAIATAWAVCLVNPPGSLAAAGLVDDAEAIVNVDASKLTEAPYTALQTLIDEMRVVHHLSPSAA
jgi:hypothetical protein